METKEKMVSLSELQKHLESLLPKVTKDKRVAEEDKKRIDALLDVYLWAKEKSGNA